jgi:hypothetical protein
VSAAAFYSGLAGLFVFVALNVFIAVRLRARLLPDWHGSWPGWEKPPSPWVWSSARQAARTGRPDRIWSLLAVSALIAAFAWLVL